MKTLLLYNYLGHFRYIRGKDPQDCLDQLLNEYSEEDIADIRGDMEFLYADTRLEVQISWGPRVEYVVFSKNIP